MSRRRATKRFSSKLIGLSAATSLVLGSLGYAAYQSAGKPIADALGCYPVANPSHTLVLVDASEPRWNDEQGRSLRRALDGVYDALPFNERLSFFTSENDQIGSVPEARFRVCGTPRSGDDLAAIGADTATGGYLARQKTRLNEEVLAPELDALLADAPDESRRQRYQSPILEMLSDLSRTTEFANARELIVVSDLLQNSESTDKFCVTPNAMPSFTSFEKRHVYRNRLAPRSFEGIRVKLLMVQRWGYGTSALPRCRDEDELRGFWEDYFAANGASSVDVVRIRLGAGAQ